MTMSLEGLPVLLEAFWKSGVVLGAALCINILLRKQSADMRRLVLSTAIVAMFVAAAASPALPRWTTPIPAWLQRASPDSAAGERPAVLALSPTTGTILSVRRTAPLPPPSRSDRAVAWVPLIWLAGTLLLLTRFALGLRGLHRLRSKSHAMTNHHHVTLMQNENIAAPVTWGIFRPVILLPAHFEQLPAESRDAVLCHELAHIQGHDFAMRVLVEIARAALWFQPLVWIASRHLREEQELACDNRVLEAGGRPSAYARMLLDWDTRPGAGSPIAVGMAHRSCLKRRLHSVLSQDVRRDAVPATGVVVAWFLGLAAALPLAAIGLTTTVPVRPVAAPRLVYAAPMPVAAPAQIPAAPQPRVQIAQVKTAPVQESMPGRDTFSYVRSGPLPRFSTNVTLVIADASVKDASGRPIEGLRAGDFVITEDGVPQAIRVFDFQKLDDAASGIASYYILGYYSTNVYVDGSYRRTRIALGNDTTARLDYRAGYYSNKNLLAIDGSGKLFMVDGVTCLSCDNPVGPGPTFPVLVSRIQPEYSEEARKAKYSGTLTLQVEVDAMGNVAGVKVMKSLGMGLDDKAREAVTQWKFKPGMIDGKPAAVQVLVDVHFALM